MSFAARGAVLLLCAPGFGAQPTDALWSGEFEGIQIRWTASDLILTRGGRAEPLFVPAAKKIFESIVAEEKKEKSAKPLTCSLEQTFRLLSVVGPLVNFEETENAYCGSDRPGIERRYTTIDIRQPGLRHINLTDYFDEQQILEVISADRVIRKVLGDDMVGLLSALPSAFNGHGYAYELPPDFLTRFAFHHVERNQAAIRIAMPGAMGANRSMHQQLGLLLKMRPDIAKWLADAASGRHGFLSAQPPAAVRNPIVVKLTETIPVAR